MSTSSSGTVEVSARPFPPQNLVAQPLGFDYLVPVARPRHAESSRLMRWCIRLMMKTPPRRLAVQAIGQGVEERLGRRRQISHQYVLSMT